MSDADPGRDRKTEEAQLQLAAIIESSEDAIISKTLDGTITSWNPGAERLYGYAAADMVGQPIARLVPPKYPDEIPAIFARLRRGERIRHYETVRVRKDSTLVDVSLSISPLIHPTGEIVGAATIARDITDRKTAEAQIRHLQESALLIEHAGRAAAEDAVRMRDSFVAVASHELRTPLTIIKSTAQLLLMRFDRGPVESARVVDGLRLLNKKADELSMLVADMLDVSRLRTGQLPLRPARLDLGALAEEVVNEQERRLCGKRPIKIRIYGALPPVSADHSRMRQVLANLIENAIKYSPGGGKIDISLREQDSGVWVTVSDDGIGLPTGTAVSIFEPFARAGNAQRRHISGMGLGLYITRQIVEQHGGRSWANSAGEGQGAQLNFWLPGIALAETTGPRLPRVLVVDDEAAVRSALGDTFEFEGYECRLAGNGREAIDILADWGPDLIVLDLMMPIMDGWAFRREQQAVLSRRGIPVVIMSAGRTRDARDAELAPDAFLVKPFEMDDLVKTVQHILTRESPRQAMAL